MSHIITPQPCQAFSNNFLGVEDTIGLRSGINARPITLAANSINKYYASLFGIFAQRK